MGFQHTLIIHIHGLRVLVWRTGGAPSCCRGCCTHSFAYRNMALAR